MKTHSVQPCHVVESRSLSQPLVAQLTPLQRRLMAEGFRVQPAVMVADLNAVAESVCPHCGSSDLTVTGYWKGPRTRLAIRCLDCQADWEG